MAMLEIQLNNEEQLTAEAHAMVYIKGNIEVKTTTTVCRLSITKVGIYKDLLDRDMLNLTTIAWEWN
jgi:uncharacterized protein (AIM24 family)